MGNKNKLIDKIKSMFPENINTFYDVFVGGGDVVLNVEARNKIANDLNSDLIASFNYIKNYGGNIKERLIEIENEYFKMNTYEGKAIRSWQNEKKIFNMLFESKKKEYYKLREEYNNSKTKDYLILYSLIINSFGLVEFRSVNGYCTYTCGKGRLNDKIVKSLDDFQERVKTIKYINKDFSFLYETEFKENDFVYLDPPYLGTSQYKDRWSEDDEVRLYEVLDYLDSKGVKFALSNFKDGVNHDNAYLSRWMGKYNVIDLEDNHRALNRFNKSNRIEVLVTNY